MTKFPYKRIISYGCSFTAGSELTDHEIIGMDEKDLFSYVEKNNIKGTHQLFEFLKISEEKMHEIFASNAATSWPNFISKHFNVPLANRAVPGTSLPHATYKLLNDLHYSAIEEDDLVIVGVTSPNRWFQFLENGDEGWGVFGIGWNTRFNVEYQKKLEEHWFNEYNIIYSHFKELTFLSDLSDRLGGRIKLCYTFGNPDYLKHFLSKELENPNFANFFDFSVKMCPTHNFINLTTSISDLAGWRDDSKHHVFGHPRVQFHKQFANILIEKMEKMYND